MDSGYFFELREGSDLLKGHILFSYTGLKIEKKSEYPVFLVFNDESIDFYFTGLIKKEKNIPHPEFVENKLFSLNLHKGKENILQLNDSLKDLFDLKFPIIKDIGIYEGEDNRNTDKFHITYADLNVFPEVNSDNNLKKKNKKIQQKKGQEQETDKEKKPNQKIFYKTLFLDFIFDVYHSDVFENSPAFTQIKQHLEEIPFIQAIKRKAEFYYQVENNKSDKKLVTFDSTNSNYIDKLIKAQEDWLDILQEENSNKFINKDNKWFKDVETEVKDVFAKQLIGNEFTRSEERRVGKECRSRWSPYH